MYGPPTHVIWGVKYILTFLDLSLLVIPLMRKSDGYQLFIQLFRGFSRDNSILIQLISIICGGEYGKLSNYFNDHSIIQGLTYPHIHDQLGSAERNISYILDNDLTLLAQWPHPPVPLKFWHFVFATSLHLINRMPHLHCKATPFQVTFHLTPYSFLKISMLYILYLEPITLENITLNSSGCISWLQP